MEQDLTRDTSDLRAPIRNVANQERHCTTRSKHVRTKVRDGMEDALKQAPVESAEERAWAVDLIFSQEMKFFEYAEDVVVDGILLRGPCLRVDLLRTVDNCVTEEVAQDCKHSVSEEIPPQRGTSNTNGTEAAHVSGQCVGKSGVGGSPSMLTVSWRCLNHGVSSNKNSSGTLEGVYLLKIWMILTRSLSMTLLAVESESLVYILTTLLIWHVWRTGSARTRLCQSRARGGWPT